METGDRIEGRFRGKPGGEELKNGGAPVSTDSDLVDRPRGEGPH